MASLEEVSPSLKEKGVSGAKDIGWRYQRMKELMEMENLPQKMQ